MIKFEYTGLKIISKSIVEDLGDILNNVFILNIIFIIINKKDSIEEKIIRKKEKKTPYDGSKKMQDIIGIRIVTYFKDDIDIITSILNKKYSIVERAIDNPLPTEFKPKRTNIVCKLPDNQKDTFNSSADKNLMDDTFEIQLRTILSEGWHEIDHSLRYKCEEDWKDHLDKSRLLNGIYATLETSDMALKSLFDDLAYSHFKEKKWEALLRSKFRIKLSSEPLNQELKDFFDKNQNIAKVILKLDRLDFLRKWSDSNIIVPYPISINNLLYIIGTIEQETINNDELHNLIPDLIKLPLKQL